MKIRWDHLATVVQSPDRLGRNVDMPRQGMATFWRSIPGLASQFRQIPAEFWVEDADDAGHTVAVVACPCGESPGVLALASDECPCGRIYFFDSRHVYVGNSPVPAVRAIPWPEGEPIPGEPSGGPTA